MSALVDPTVFRRAADAIEQRGLYQGFFCPPGQSSFGPVCAVGALGVAVTGNPLDWDESPDVVAAVEAVGRSLPGEPPTSDGAPDWAEHVAAWNDTPGRTAAEVVAVLIAAADVVPVWVTA